MWRPLCVCTLLFTCRKLQLDIWWLCTSCFPNSCAKDYARYVFRIHAPKTKDYLTAGGCRECHSSAANEDGYDILWYRSGTLDRRTCLIMSFHFRDGMWLTQEPPCRLMIWTWFHLFIKDDGLRILSGMYNHIVIAVHFQKSTVCDSRPGPSDYFVDLQCLQSAKHKRLYADVRT